MNCLICVNLCASVVPILSVFLSDTLNRRAKGEYQFYFAAGAVEFASDIAGGFALVGQCVDGLMLFIDRIGDGNIP